jgi:hypothetical protein
MKNIMQNREQVKTDIFLEFEEKQWNSLQILGYIGILQLLRIMFTEMYCRIAPIAVFVLVDVCFIHQLTNPYYALTYLIASFLMFECYLIQFYRINMKPAYLEIGWCLEAMKEINNRKRTKSKFKK